MVRGPIATALAGLAALLCAPGAQAAQEIGDPCVANDTDGAKTWIAGGSRTAGPQLPPVWPYGGVITSWTVRVEAGQEAQAQRLDVYQGVAEEEFRKVAESATEIVGPGENSFPARLPYPEYGHIALYGPAQTFFCDKQDESDANLFEGAVALGETKKFEVTLGNGVPVTAIVEPDADGDGYGDETQDGCPQSSLFTGVCPPPVTLIVEPQVRKRSILLGVTPSAAASVDVYGQVGWNFQAKRGKQRGHPRHRSAHASKRKKGIKRLIVGLDGGTKQVTPGVLTRFTIRLPGPVKLRLSRLTRRESIRAKLTLRATNPAGIAKNTRLRVKLRGWRKPTPTRRGAHR